MPQAALYEVVVILVLILINGLFAMSEIAVVSSRRPRLQQMINDGHRGARVALALAQSPSRFLSTTQVGISIVGILAGAFGGATLAEHFADYLEQFPAVAPYSEAISLAVIVSSITYLSVVLGELVPKRFALQNPERMAALTGRPMQLLATAATPVVRLLELSTDMVLRLLGIHGASPAEVSEEEIRILVEQGAEAGIIEEAERDLVESIFRLGDRPLQAIMTPRTEIAWLDLHGPIEENRRLVQETPFSRFPVCDGGLDRPLGIIHAKDFFAACVANREPDLRQAMAEPLFLPENMQTLRALEHFKRSGAHMALLMDEYGGIDGLVTLINILEAIVGDIPTAEELVEPPVVRRDDGSWLVDGLLTVEEFKELFGFESLPGEATYQTIGGFLIYRSSGIPTTGTQTAWGGYTFEVVDMDGYRVDKILVTRQPSTDDSLPPSPRSPII
jgi:putative hemolysin